MICPSCEQDNPPDAVFCLKCGEKLTPTCKECGLTLPVSARFCYKCGSPVEEPSSNRVVDQPGDGLTSAVKRLLPREYVQRLQEASGLVTPERRLVTILFSDIKGSTALADGLDPEDVMEIINGAFDALIGPVYRYEGTLARLMGDAVLAFFGAPITHEDDPERACRAGLDIIRNIKRYAAELREIKGIGEFNVRVGINTGLVVVGEVGTDMRVEYTAIGDTINLAARLENAAEPGTVLISESTRRLIAPLFETEAMGSIQMKGKPEPVPVYQVLGVKAGQHKLRGVSGLESPLVGRDGEFFELKEAFKRLETGIGGIVTLVGEAGLGKSRLVAELHKKVQSGGMHWVEGRCLSYGTSIAYQLWLDVLRALLGVSVETDTTEVQRALSARVNDLCPDRVKEVYLYLKKLMSLPLDPQTEENLINLEAEKLKWHTFQALEDLIACTAEGSPLVLVCEDLQWADPTSIELLERLLSLTDRTSLLIICVFRPDPDHGSWLLREKAARKYRHRHTDIWLRPLTFHEGEALVDNLLQGKGLSEQFTERILSFAEGNPFYVEEVLRSLIDQEVLVFAESLDSWQVKSDIIDVPLPDTLQGVLMARIDRLQEETKRVLQVASVIGRIFLHRVLASIAPQELELDDHLLTLQRQEMIRERSRLPELEYIFKHHLTQDAAYKGLLRRERRTYHRQVAEALETLFPMRIEEQVELLAHHWQRAGVYDKAVAYLIQAGERARKNYACTEALQHYSLALELAESASLPEETLAAIHEQRGRAFASIANMSSAREDLQVALAWSRRNKDKKKEAEILLDLIEPLVTGHELGEALECAQSARTIGNELGDSYLITRSTSAIGAVLCVKGELRQADEYLQAGLKAARKHASRDILAETLAYSALERGWMGDFNGALEVGAEALAHGDELRNPSMIARIYLMISLAQCGLGEYENALVSMAQADQLADKTGLTTRPAEILNSKGWVYQEIYDLQRSSQLNMEGVQVAREQGEIESEANALVNLGVDYLWMGDPHRAEGCFEEADDLLEKQFGGYRWRWKTRLLAAWGELHLIRDEPEKALEYAQRCLELAESTSAKKNLVKGWLLEGKALAALDHPEEGESALVKAVNLAEEISNPPLIWKCHYAQGRLLEKLGREVEAQEQFSQAARVIKRTADSLKDPNLRQTFLSAGPVSVVLKLIQ